ncbi:pentapeptide repeat-containing protein [Tumidithrix elongata RA019]|uniref:Pentapeptide repeat-containing protein n=1 Tax=Tumidithrix elongata BACA0141 TaxID=2716417 RepID=A0AAW9PPA5_9CYAN|nr:pentapeptide repeat-containing protein [Tumidithrix elongata RA019]
MPLDKNKTNQGRGSNDPSQNTAGSGGAEEIDWLILSDLGSKTNSSINDQGKNQSNDAIQSLNEILSDDQEDIDWLQSIGLDEPVTGITAYKTTGSDSSAGTTRSDPKSSNVGDIDWLIVTDLKTRMDDTDFKFRNQQSIASESPQNESLDFSLSDTSEPDDTLPELLEGILAQKDLGLESLDLSMEDQNFDLDLEGLSIDDGTSDLDLEGELGAMNLDTDDNWSSNSLDLDLSEGNEWNLSENLGSDISAQSENFDFGDDLSLESSEEEEVENLDLDLDLNFDRDLQDSLGDLNFSGDLNDEIISDEVVSDEVVPESASFDLEGLDEGIDLDIDLNFDPDPQASLSEENGDEFGESEALNPLENVSSENVSSETISDALLDPLDDLSEDFGDVDFELEFEQEPAAIARIVSTSFEAEQSSTPEAEVNADLYSDVNADLYSLDGEIVLPESDELLDRFSGGALNQVFDEAFDSASNLTTDLESPDDWLSPSSIESNPETIDENLDGSISGDFTWEQGASSVDLVSPSMDDDWAGSPSLETQTNSPDLESLDLIPDQMDDFATWDQGSPVSSEMDDDWAGSPSLEAQTDSPDLESFDLIPDQMDDFATWDQGFASADVALSGMDDAYKLEASTYEQEASTYELEASTYELEASTYEQEASTYELEASAYEQEAFAPQVDLTSDVDSEYLDLGAQLEQELEEFIADTSGHRDDAFNLQSAAGQESQYENFAVSEYSERALDYSDADTNWNMEADDFNSLGDLEPTTYFTDTDPTSIEELSLNPQSVSNVDPSLDFEDGFEVGIESFNDSGFNAQPQQTQQRFEFETGSYNDSPSGFEFNSSVSNDAFEENDPFEAEIDRNNDLDINSDLTAMLPQDITEVINDLDAIDTENSSFNDLGFEDSPFNDVDIDTAFIEHSGLESTVLSELDREFDDLADLRQAVSQLGADPVSQAIPKSPVAPPPVEAPYVPSPTLIPAPPVIASQATAQTSDDDSDLMSTFIDTSKSDFLDDFDLDNVDSDFMNQHLSPNTAMTDRDFDPTLSSSLSQSNLDRSEDEPYRAPMPMPLPPLPSRKSPPKAPAKPPSNFSRPDAFSSASPNVPKAVPPQPPLPFDVEEEWSGLLDSDGQMTDSTFSSTSFSSDRNRATNLNPNSLPPKRQPPQSPNPYGQPPNSQTQVSDGHSQGRKKPKGLSLPSLDELDNFTLGGGDDDWTGLLDMNTQISGIKPAAETTRSRFDTNASNIDTRESVRRAPQPTMSGFGGNTRSTQFASRGDSSGALPSQRPVPSFAEDIPEGKAPKAKVKVKVPTVDFETLWQKYLKLPVIGLGAIGIFYVGFLFLQRPIIELALKMQWLKDVSGRDFSGANFKEVKLDDVNFSKANLSGANLEGASLKGANLVEANLDSVTFTKANLKGARLIKASIVASNLKNAQLPFADLHGADLTRSNFLGANLEGASLAETKIGKGADRTKFESKDLLMWQIVNEPKAGRNLSGLNLSGFNLNSANLKSANLTEAKLSWADLTSANLTSANLTGATLNGANLSGANLKGVDLTDVKIDPDKQPQTNEETTCPNGSKGPCKFQ